VLAVEDAEEVAVELAVEVALGTLCVLVETSFDAVLEATSSTRSIRPSVEELVDA
jgi:hypothetical protein